ncbi:MAG: nitrate reductase cytochrome c-type subunit [Helicobacteraceae bacterium]|nr:nitrate reductase cytochrome c-type subunit [Helicobacteraceae bacterium]
MKKKIFGFLAFMLVIIGCGSAGISEDSMGFRSTPLNSENVVLQDYSYIATPAGESITIERSYENAPPMISHDTEGMMEITQDMNMCLSCHSPENAKLTNIISVPESHTFDTFTGKKTNDVVDARFNCVACHTPQVNAMPLVKNNFKADFRNEIDKKKSNLLDILDEGVE